MSESLFSSIIKQARAARLLHPMDADALLKLAELNHLQQKAARMNEYSVEYKELRTKFSLLYNWLHELNHYSIHRDEQTGLWRLGTYLSRKGRRC